MPAGALEQAAVARAGEAVGAIGQFDGAGRQVPLLLERLVAVRWVGAHAAYVRQRQLHRAFHVELAGLAGGLFAPDLGPGDQPPPDDDQTAMHGRTEERRVGKEGRSRWAPYH